MNLEALKRPLTIDEIDFRIQSINNGGYATILAYKDARTDMNRLDEAFGVCGWQRKHELINGQLFCSVGIFDGSQWVWKQDVGTESNTEAEKGQASDAFKRACFNLGIGRELYEYPVISIKLDPDEWEKGQGNAKPRQTWNLKLREWNWKSEFTDGKISALFAVDQNGKRRFSWIADGAKPQPKQGEPEPVKPKKSGIEVLLRKMEDNLTEQQIGQVYTRFGKDTSKWVIPEVSEFIQSEVLK